MLNFSFLSRTGLFQGISEDELKTMLDCLTADTHGYSKDTVIFHMGDSTQRMGMVLSGGVHIVRYDVWGNQNILNHIGPGQVFAETYACIPGERLTVSVITAEPTQVLFLNVRRVLQTCPSACSHHTRLLRNLLSVMATKNLSLTQKINHITPKSIRERLLSYLSAEAIRQNSYQFQIPFNRQQLADYLSVERSALSNELSKMQRDGLISYHKNQFLLLCPPEQDSQIPQTHL